VTTQQIEFIITLLAGIGGLLVATASLAWFIAEQFKKTRAEFWTGITNLHNTIMMKIDDHQKEDDHRFDAITRQVWNLEVRFARRDGDASPPYPDS
jgi:hypothetical protein